MRIWAAKERVVEAPERERPIGRNGRAAEHLPIAASAEIEALRRNGHGPVLAARDLWFSYDGRSYALRGVDLEIERGSITMILGRSGSGKTTLLKALDGLLKPQRGSVETFGANGRNGSRARHRVAYVPQTLGLVRSMSALENTLTGALGYTPTVLSLLKLFPRDTVAKAKQTLTDLGLGAKLNEKVHALSGGERQRVAIARALMHRPEVILADEFVSQLDPVTTEEILTMMRAIAERGVALLITTHETDVVAGYADRLVVMREGGIIHDGPARDVSVAAMTELLR